MNARIPPRWVTARGKIILLPCVLTRVDEPRLGFRLSLPNGTTREFQDIYWGSAMHAYSAACRAYAELAPQLDIAHPLPLRHSEQNGKACRYGIPHLSVELRPDHRAAEYWSARVRIRWPHGGRSFPLGPLKLIPRTLLARQLRRAAALRLLADEIAPALPRISLPPFPEPELDALVMRFRNAIGRTLKIPSINRLRQSLLEGPRDAIA